MLDADVTPERNTGDEPVAARISTPTPTIPITLNDLIRVFELAAPRLEWFSYPRHDLTFSCSPTAIWPTTRKGGVPINERVHVEAKSWVLDLVALLVRELLNPRGSRFVVTLDGAFLASDHTPICRFEVGA